MKQTVEKPARYKPSQWSGLIWLAFGIQLAHHLMIAQNNPATIVIISIAIICVSIAGVMTLATGK